MNQMATLPGVENARLPQTYANAKSALYSCVSIDECQSWADKAAALASRTSDWLTLGLFIAVVLLLCEGW